MTRFFILLLLLAPILLAAQSKESATIEYDSRKNVLLINNQALELPVSVDTLEQRLKVISRNSGGIYYFDNEGLLCVADSLGIIREISIQFSPKSGNESTTSHFRGKFLFDDNVLYAQTDVPTLRSVIRASRFPFDIMFDALVKVQNMNFTLMFLVGNNGYLDTLVIKL